MTDVTVHFLSFGLTLVDRQADAGGFDHDITADRIDRGVFTQVSRSCPCGPKSG